MHKEVYVIIPALNEAGTIGDLLAGIPASIDGHEVTALVIDDGSTDETADVVRALDVALIQQPANRGKGAAIRRAMDELRAVDANTVAWMDSDGQHLPSSLPAVVRPVLFDGVDLCVGSRYLEAERVDLVPLNRRLVRLITIRAIQAICGTCVTDPYSGFRCFSRAAIDALDLKGSGYETELESCFSVARAGLSFREVPIPRIYGPKTSKMGYRHGALRGRIVVLAGYTRTFLRAWRQRNAPAGVPADG